MRRPRGLAWLAVLGSLGIGLVGPRYGEGQVRSISGTLRSSASFNEQRVGGTVSQQSELQHDYTLGVRGLILDPRLATFEVTGGLAGTNVVLGRGEGVQIFSGGLNLNVLPFSRIPVTLRHFQSHGGDGNTSDVMSSSLTWRMSHPLYPSLSLNVERTAVKTSGLSRAESDLLAGTLRSTYSREDLDLFGEVGARRADDAVQRTTTMSQFANFTGTYRPSAATNVQGAANYFEEEGRLSAGVNATLTNRPDPTLTRTAAASFKTTHDVGTTYSLDASGNISKNYRLSPSLQAFLSGGAGFAADVVGEGQPAAIGITGTGQEGGFTSLTASGGGGVTYSGLRYVVGTADANLAALYEDDQRRGFGGRGTFHLGLTGKNLGPVTAGADYTFRSEAGVVNSSDHTVSLRANVVAPLRPTLRLEGFAQSGMFVQRGDVVGPGAGTSLGITGGGRATYTGISFLTWELASQYRLAKSGVFESQFVTTSTTMTYTPLARLQARLTAIREDDLITRDIRHSVQADVSYRIGATTVSLTYSLDMLSGRTDSPMFQRVLLTWSRPFGWRFR